MSAGVVAGSSVLGMFIPPSLLPIVCVGDRALTPPPGLTYFVSIDTERRPDHLKQIFAGAIPFIGIMLLVTTLLIAVPRVTLAFV